MAKRRQALGGHNLPWDSRLDGASMDEPERSESDSFLRLPVTAFPCKSERRAAILSTRNPDDRPSPRDTPPPKMYNSSDVASRAALIPQSATPARGTTKRKSSTHGLYVRLIACRVDRNSLANISPLSRMTLGTVLAVGTDYVLIKRDGSSNKRIVIAKSALSRINLDSEPVRFTTR